MPPPFRVAFAPNTNSVTLPDEPSVIVPALLMFPPTVRTTPFRIVAESPAWLRVRVPTVKFVSTSVAAVVRLIRMFSPLVIAPLFQLLASLHLILPLPPPPVQVSVVAGGGTFGVAARAKARLPVTGA